jgi:phosphatidylglycerophosphate synthase
LILQRHWIPALIGYLVIAFSDVLDGIAARRRHEETRFGFRAGSVRRCPVSDHGVREPLSAVGFTPGLSPRSSSGTDLIFGCVALFLMQGRIWIRPTPFGRATGVALGAGTVLLLYGPLSGWKESSLALIEKVIAVLFAAGAIHVLMIGWVNLPSARRRGVRRLEALGIKITRDQDR